jgi:hypothetical protein
MLTAFFEHVKYTFDEVYKFLKKNKDFEIKLLKYSIANRKCLSNASKCGNAVELVV